MGASATREILAEKVITLFNSNAYAFGGYLRDKIAGDDFTDLDLFFPTYSHGMTYSMMNSYDVRGALRDAGLTAMREGMTKKIYSPETGMRLTKETYQVSDPATGVKVSVDIVRSLNGMEELDHPFTALDADVNSLWFNKKTGKVETAPNMGYSMQKVMEHIAQKIFELPANSAVSAERLNKLFNKGYKPFEATNSQPANGRKEHKMESGGFMDQFKADMEKAAYRSCGTQMTSAVKQGILLAMKNGGAEEGVLSHVSKMLDTEGGTALVSALLGHGLPHAPIIGADPRVSRLSEEFRVAGYAQGMNLLFAALMQYVMPGIMQALQNLPPITVTEKDMAELDALSKAKMRVSGHSPEVPDLSAASELEQLAELEALRKRTRTA